MKPRLFWLTGIPLFAIGVTAGWRLNTVSGSGGGGEAGSPSASGSRSGSGMEGAVPGEIPPPSGLPDDFIHLASIRDTRGLRAAWGAAGESARQMLIWRWSQLDPVDGIRYFLRESVSGRPRDADSADAILQLWSRREPTACLGYLCGLSREAEFGAGFSSVVEHLVEKRMATAPEEVLALWRRAGAPARRAMCGTVFSHLFEKDPARALREMADIPADCRDDAWHVADSASDPSLVLRALEEDRSLSCSSYYYEVIFEAFAKKDPVAARTMAENLPPGSRRSSACKAVIAQMAEEDPHAALVWMEAHSPSRENRDSVYKALAKTDPADALSLYEESQMPFPGDVIPYISELAEQDWEGTRARAESLPNRAQRDEMLAIMARSLEFEPDNFLPQLKKLGGLLAGSELKGEIFYQDAWSKLGSAELPAVRAWLERQPDDVREMLQPTLLEQLRTLDEADAADWLIHNPPSGTRTRAVIAQVTQWANNDPQAAAKFSQNLPPGTEQEYAVLNTALSWNRQNSAAARQWLDSLPDSPAKTRALQELGISTPKP